MRLISFILPALALLFPLTAAHALEPLEYEVEAMGSLSSGENTPFWLTANRQGLGDVSKGYGFVRAAAKMAAPERRRLTFGFGADLVGSWRSDAPFLVRELYGEMRYRDFILSVGPRTMADTARLVNPRLSSGDLLFSGNALPIPEVRLAMPAYLNIPGLRGWLGFKAYISYGRFTDSGWQRSFSAPDSRTGWTEDVLFHSKGLHLRIGPANAPFRFEGGLEMAAQFGGRLIKGDSVVASMGNGTKHFWKVLFPGSGDDSPVKGERTNILGNHVGEWSARLTWQPNARPFTLAAYYLHFFDDHSMMFFNHPWRDGLFGLELSIPGGRWITGAVYEFLSTTDQSGPVYWDHTPAVPEQVSGRDDYYNNFIYNAWQHWGLGIGNPLIIAPEYNSDGVIAFQCNRIRSHHWAITGRPLPQLSYRILASYTRGWGTYKRPYYDVKTNLNLLLEATWSPSALPGWSASLALASDSGHLLGSSFGAALTLRKTGILKL